jgi:hypothetical protein
MRWGEACPIDYEQVDLLQPLILTGMYCRMGVTNDGMCKTCHVLINTLIEYYLILQGKAQAGMAWDASLTAPAL